MEVRDSQDAQRLADFPDALAARAAGDVAGAVVDVAHDGGEVARVAQVGAFAQHDVVLATRVGVGGYAGFRVVHHGDPFATHEVGPVFEQVERRGEVAVGAHAVALDERAAVDGGVNLRADDDGFRLRSLLVQHVGLGEGGIFVQSAAGRNTQVNVGAGRQQQGSRQGDEGRDFHGGWPWGAVMGAELRIGQFIVFIITLPSGRCPWRACVTTVTCFLR